MEKQYLVIDVEATCCDDDSFPRDHMEVIEIGALLVDGESLEPLRELQTFVRPVRHQQLTAFCTRLTTITQAQVDAAPRFPDAMALLRQFLDGTAALFSSWGAYDRGQLERDARFHGVALPLGARHFNIKEAFARRLGERRGLGTSRALGRVGLRFAGTRHRAVDDARNIARLLPWALGRA
jgi:inhibitor of KinA sporulation pathway (predicted exonuclease)